ncbi:NUDIX hydrolase [Litchfieldia alkalitelluris]|nr:hypothetical protein [Litchfieldia alkalitelluris]
MGYIKELRNLVGPMPLILNSAGVLLFNGQKVLLLYRKDTNDWGIPG